MLNYEPEKRPSAYDCMRILKEIAVDMKYKKNIPDVYNDDKITEFDTQEWIIIVSTILYLLFHSSQFIVKHYLQNLYITHKTI